MIGDKDLSVPAKMLDFYALRQRLLAHNVANAQVKGFHRLDAGFGRELLDAIKAGDVKALEKAEFTVKEAKQPGVQAEHEVAEMTKNSLLFESFSQIAAFRLRMLRTALGK